MFKPILVTFILLLTAGRLEAQARDQNYALVINEIMASAGPGVRAESSDELMDEDRDYPDWIELKNVSDSPVDVGGYYLTDDPSWLYKWAFPASTRIGPGEFLVVFASGKNRNSAGLELHTNFRLSVAGEFLALTHPDGVIIDQMASDQFTKYPAQQPGVSYGRFGGSFQYFEQDPAQPDSTGPSPGRANHAGFSGFVADPEFSKVRGFHDTDFMLDIRAGADGASIRYTTNGEWPTEHTGTIYSRPIAIQRTQPVRAVAYRDGWKSSEVVTHTYLFVDDVVQQSAQSTREVYGFPEMWGDVPAYYGMRQSVVEVHPTIRDDLKKIPTIALTLDLDDLFNTDDGIYSNPENKGVTWERAASMEIIDPTGNSGTQSAQLNCGIRIQGGAFRRFNVSRKKSFRVLFKKKYGPSKLRYDFFPGAPLAAREFDTLTLRMVSNDGYQWDGIATVQYARDEFARRSARDLGLPASHGRYIHLYVNGVYWGLYNPVERPDAGFARSYLDAEKEEWDGLNTGRPINESGVQPWKDMLAKVADISLARGEPERTNALMQVQGLDERGEYRHDRPDYIDIDGFSDYMLLNWYLDNKDWPHHNSYVGRQRDAHDPPGYRSRFGKKSDGFRFFVWDAEATMLLSDIIDNSTKTFDGVAAPQKHLRNSEEYRVRFGDRAHRALFNDGPLTARQCRLRYDTTTSLHPFMLIPELARWGGQHGNEHSIESWRAQREFILKHWCEWRTAEFVESLKYSKPALYPALAAPVYAPHGGSISRDARIILTAPETGTDVYYKFGPQSETGPGWHDDLDPRLIGGGVDITARQLAIDYVASPPVLIKTGAVWKYLDDGTDQGAAWRDPGFDDSSWPSGPSQLGYGDGDEGTTVGFIDVNPGRNGAQRNATTYFRNTVDVPDPDTFSYFDAAIVYDDAYVVYVNGVEVARHSSLPADPAFDRYSRVHVSRENALARHRIPADVFHPGANSVAVEIHQVFSGSSDMSFDLALTGRSPSLLELPEPVVHSGWLKSRTYNRHSGEWSALNTAFFSVDSEPASARNLVVSRLGYDPGNPGERDHSAWAQSYKFVELMNISPGKSVDLTGVSFVSGVGFSFADHTLIPPGGRLIIVSNKAAFEQRFSALPENVIYGRSKLGNVEFRGSLDNTGERIVLYSASQGVIHSFVFSTFPGISHRYGHSIVLSDPESAPDHGDDSNWEPVPNQAATY